jgi:hypothetical protein
MSLTSLLGSTQSDSTCAGCCSIKDERGFRSGRSSLLTDPCTRCLCAPIRNQSGDPVVVLRCIPGWALILTTDRTALLSALSTTGRRMRSGRGPCTARRVQLAPPRRRPRAATDHIPVAGNETQTRKRYHARLDVVGVSASQKTHTCGESAAIPSA